MFTRKKFGPIFFRANTADFGGADFLCYEKHVFCEVFCTKKIGTQKIRQCLHPKGQNIGKKIGRKFSTHFLHQNSSPIFVIPAMNALQPWMHCNYECVTAMNALQLWMHYSYECITAMNALQLWMHSSYACITTMNALQLWIYCLDGPPRGTPYLVLANKIGTPTCRIFCV